MPGVQTMVHAVPFQYPSLQVRQVVLLVHVLQGVMQLSQVLLVGLG